MDMQPVVKQTDKGFALGCQHKGDQTPRWLWTIEQKMIAELWFMGIRTIPSEKNSGSKFTVYLYADTHTEAWYLWENKMAPWLLASKLARTEKAG